MVKLSSRQGIERTRRSIKAHSRGHQPHMFAVLETDHAPVDESVLLVQDSETEPSNKFEFRSLVEFEERKAVLGTIAPRAQSSALRHSSIQVKRGRLGNKAAETLLILNRLPVGLLENPGPVLKGMLKSVGRALDQINCNGRPHNLHWWLAIELAMKGWVRRQSVESLAAELDCNVPTFGPGIIPADGLYIWTEYLDRTIDQLEQQLESPKNRNPFNDRLVATTIANLLGIRDPGICAVLIGSFAQRHNCEVLPDVQVLSCNLPTRFVSELDDEDRAIGDEIVALFENGEGVSRHSLEQKYPSSMHVIANLFLCGKLVASPEGFIFTREQLIRYRDILLAAGEDLSRPSVRVIKDECGLGRRAAESLQGLFADLFRDGYTLPPQEHGA
ncbi:MAG: hypothetical protein H7A35_12875 [Planctomycetales bacterium]|nr:hypothetical protein [bacterium]UNM07740.1 MAG: hypothetical protein H7A35_12875 [Planctomycetales bacterium]